jgi:hypothetical protein
VPSQHPSRSWRGCAMCKPHKRRGAGRAAKDPVATRRRLGYTRRYTHRSLDRGWPPSNTPRGRRPIRHSDELSCSGWMVAPSHAGEFASHARVFARLR